MVKVEPLQLQGGIWRRCLPFGVCIGPGHSNKMEEQVNNSATSSTPTSQATTVEVDATPSFNSPSLEEQANNSATSTPMSQATTVEVDATPSFNSPSSEHSPSSRRSESVPPPFTTDGEDGNPSASTMPSQTIGRGGAALFSQRSIQNRTRAASVGSPLLNTGEDEHHGATPTRTRLAGGGGDGGPGPSINRVIRNMTIEVNHSADVLAAAVAEYESRAQQRPPTPDPPPSDADNCDGHTVVVRQHCGDCQYMWLGTLGTGEHLGIRKSGILNAKLAPAPPFASGRWRVTCRNGQILIVTIYNAHTKNGVRYSVEYEGTKCYKEEEEVSTPHRTRKSTRRHTNKRRSRSRSRSKGSHSRKSSPKHQRSKTPRRDKEVEEEEDECNEDES